MGLPTFVIAGTAKAGTTSLWRYLDQHPEIFMSMVKEPHYFAYHEGVPRYEGPGDVRRLDSMVVTDLEDYAALFDGADSAGARGEASTMYLYLPQSAAKMAELVPDLRIVAVLRAPVDRAYSAFEHHVRDGLETESFQDALALEWAGKRDRWSPAWQYWRMGQYYSQLHSLFEHFPRRQVLVVLYDELQTRPVETVQRIFGFIGVDRTFIPDVSSMSNVAARPRSTALHRFLIRQSPWKGAVRRHVPSVLFEPLYEWVKQVNLKGGAELDPDFRARLLVRAEPDIAALEALLGLDLGCWRKKRDAA